MFSLIPVPQTDVRINVERRFGDFIAFIMNKHSIGSGGQQLRDACEMIRRAISRRVVDIMRELHANARIRANYAALKCSLTPSADMQYRVLTSSPRVAQKLIISETAWNDQVRSQNWDAERCAGAYFPHFLPPSHIERISLPPAETGAAELVQAGIRFARMSLYRGRMLRTANKDVDPGRFEAECVGAADEQRQMPQPPIPQRIPGPETLMFLNTERNGRGFSAWNVRRGDIDFWMGQEFRWPMGWAERKIRLAAHV
jgi:hypothetical protein